MTKKDSDSILHASNAIVDDIRKSGSSGSMRKLAHNGTNAEKNESHLSGVELVRLGFPPAYDVFGVFGGTEAFAACAAKPAHPEPKNVDNRSKNSSADREIEELRKLIKEIASNEQLASNNSKEQQSEIAHAAYTEVHMNAPELQEPLIVTKVENAIWEAVATLQSKGKVA
jgi:hypothetical protein